MAPAPAVASHQPGQIGHRRATLVAKQRLSGALEVYRPFSAIVSSGLGVCLPSSLRRGAVTTYQPNGKEPVTLGATHTGGGLWVKHRIGEDIAAMKFDEYGNGVVGAWNPKGKGRTLKPRP